MTECSKQKFFRIISAASLISSVVLCIYGLKTGILTSPEKLQRYIDGFGFAGTLMFIVFQAVQVVVPVLPGGLGCLAGVLLFGAWRGFIYNYIGICIGSVLAFLVAKYYGKPALRFFFTQRLITKYERWTSERDRFAKMFAVAIFMPIAPDDFLCYLAGTTEMTLPKFTLIIILGKPFSIALYSMGLMTVFNHMSSLLTA